MSDIHGIGHGSAHDWQRLETLPWKVTEYQCRRCRAFFSHCYDDVPDIFRAMERSGLPEQCQEEGQHG